MYTYKKEENMKNYLFGLLIVGCCVGGCELKLPFPSVKSSVEGGSVGATFVTTFEGGAGGSMTTGEGGTTGLLTVTTAAVLR